ncbi:uncharacterized protein AMSG_10884 [Thecamonas trahens ATCC 50062]|uniref:C2 NT-type domain-containing protein n=1 Tax=Thecamonas trahens ATCC 50062 TaxID=461836 RepID=A0A0L0DSK4_THETB|nr:hypothetical protein AMSG_10884 [Thecamonas trahens ATCC 50062]KNC55250.1 hypothetical protein AMSG_10884 [Thecamonas trahens ATCC 50062]|eukprot:XP_013753179.1 hypothetical protein AMSG_10884 [Thecamonas trahens ATCC 50062]
MPTTTTTTLSTALTFSVSLQLSIEPLALPTPTSPAVRPFSVTLSTHGSPAANAPLLAPTVDGAMLRCAWPAPLEITTKMLLAKDGRSLRAKPARISLMQAKKIGSRRIRPVAVADIDLAAYHSAPARDLVLPMVLTGAGSKVFASVQAVISVAVTDAPDDDNSVVDGRAGPRSREELLCAPHALIVATTKPGVLVETIIEGRHQKATPGGGSGKDKAKAKGKAKAPSTVVELATVDPASLPMGDVFVDAAPRTGFAGIVVLGSSLAIFLFAVSSYEQLMEALRQATFSTSMFRFAGVHLSGRIPGLALEPVREAALLVPLSINGRIGELSRRMLGLASPPLADEQARLFGARLLALQTLSNGFPISINDADVAAYAAALPDYRRVDAERWASAAARRENMSRDDLVAEAAAAGATAAAAVAHAAQLAASLTAADSRMETAELSVRALRATLTNERDERAAEAAAADAREAKLNVAIDEAHAALDRERAARTALAAENTALAAELEATQLELAQLKADFANQSVKLADTAYRAEQAELVARSRRA